MPNSGHCPLPDIIQWTIVVHFRQNFFSNILMKWNLISPWSSVLSCVLSRTNSFLFTPFRPFTRSMLIGCRSYCAVHWKWNPIAFLWCSFGRFSFSLASLSLAICQRKTFGINSTQDSHTRLYPANLLRWSFVGWISAPVKMTKIMAILCVNNLKLSILLQPKKKSSKDCSLKKIELSFF